MPQIPPCKNPDHPKGVPRDKGMIILEEQDHRVVFACVPCKDLNKVLSAQVVTLPQGKARAAYLAGIVSTKRAASVQRTRTGKITYFH